MRKSKWGCYKDFIPYDLWTLYKKEVRKIFAIAFPDQKFSFTETTIPHSSGEEQLRLTPKTGGPIDWKRVWSVLDFVAHEFNMKLFYTYQEKPLYQIWYEEPLIERPYSNYSFKGTKEWTGKELAEFIENYSFEKVKERFYEASI